MSLGIQQIFILNQAFPKVDATLALIQGATTANQFSCPLPANSTMQFEVYLPLTIGAAAGGWRFQVVPSVAPVDWSMGGEILDETTNAIIAINKQVASALVTGIGIAADGIIRLWGSVTAGVTDGTLNVQFAQSVVNVAASTVDRGAYFKTWRIS